MYWMLCNLHYKETEIGLARKRLCWNGLMPSSFFGKISNTEQFMEYMECSIRLCLVFLIRAVVDHTCVCGIAESCLKRDKCLSQANKTMHLPWLPWWEQEARASCRIRCSWKKILLWCSDSPLHNEMLRVCLNAPLGTILKPRWR